VESGHRVRMNTKSKNSTPPRSVKAGSVTVKIYSSRLKQFGYSVAPDRDSPSASRMNLFVSTLAAAGRKRRNMTMHDNRVSD
jgi:hypothetical protein